MLSFFEKLVRPTAQNTPGEPPKGLLRFYGFFLAQVKWYFVALLIIGLAQAAADAAIPIFIGRIVQLISHSNPADFFSNTWPALAGMIVVILILRPLIVFVQGVVQHQIIVPGLTNLIRWQSHWHVARQGIAFFQNDFAGRIGSRVMETGYALRQSAVSVVSVVWYLIALGLTAATIMARADILLLGPIVLWAIAYVVLLIFLVPRIRHASRDIAYARSALVGRIVDSYTNIATVKLFARAAVEDAYVRESVDDHTYHMHKQLRMFTVLGTGLTLLTGFLILALQLRS